MKFTTVQWNAETGTVTLLDQTRLPNEIVYDTYRDYRDVAVAIKTLKVRGAPAIGVSAAFGVVLGLQASRAATYEAFKTELDTVIGVLGATRPTAVNLFWALERMRRAAEAFRDHPVEGIKTALTREALAIQTEDQAMCRQIGLHGAALLGQGHTVLTHCNAGALATAGAGTALAVIYQAHREGKRIRVFADETRPVLQGARLTAWELLQEGIDVTLICDNMAGQVMKEGKIDCVIVGADRIAANGDTANKIGTYGVAVLASAHGIPMYVAAPFSTIDLSIRSGADIPIEERNPVEVTEGLGRRTAPEGVRVYNPAFDVTPAALVTAIITERGIARPPYIESLTALAREAWQPAFSQQGVKEGP
jgi:methylthioribose-1-phosphate isomerase